MATQYNKHKKTRPNNIRQHKTRQDNIRQYETRHDKAIQIQDKPRQVKTR